MVTSGSPATDTMSPGPASVMSTRSMPCAVWSAVTEPVRVMLRPGSPEPSASSASSRTNGISEVWVCSRFHAHSRRSSRIWSANASSAEPSGTPVMRRLSRSGG